MFFGKISVLSCVPCVTVCEFGLGEKVWGLVTSRGGVVTLWCRLVLWWVLVQRARVAGGWRRGQSRAQEKPAPVTHTHKGTFLKAPR